MNRIITSFRVAYSCPYTPYASATGVQGKFEPNLINLSAFSLLMHTRSRFIEVPHM